MLTGHELIAALGVLGITPGDTLIVHSSYKALGLSDVTPADVIQALLESLGPEGTLVMPAFTYSYTGIWNVRPFNRDTTPGVGNGVLTEVLRTWPGALRSGHPTYSVVASGKYADIITRDKEHASPLGKGSSFEEALDRGAKILLLGVGNNRNSMLHYAEVEAGLPYNDIPYRSFWGKTALVEKAGAVVEQPLPNEFPACSANFGVVDDFLAGKGFMKKGKIAAADSILIDADQMVRTVVERLKVDPAWLLCNNFVCEPCSLRKRRLKERRN